MKYFSKKLLIFLLPVFIVLFPPLFILIKSGETSSAASLLTKQYLKSNSLAGLAYSYPIKPYKLDAVKMIKPRVLVLGSSRVMQIRQYFFRGGYTFYNAGGFAGNINELDCFLNDLPAGYNPRILITGLDQYWFNAGLSNVTSVDDCKVANDSIALFSLFKFNFTGIYRDIYHGKIKLAKLFNNNNVGLSGMMNNEGFRQDGSYRYGKLLTDPETDVDYGFKDTYKRIKSGTSRFEYGTEVSEQALQALDVFLEDCYQRNIHVVAYLPPYPHIIIDTMMNMGNKYAYIKKLQAALKPLFDKYKFTLGDYTDVATTGAGPGEYLDGFHASEKAMLRVMIDLNRKDSVLRQFCDTTQMNVLLKNAKSDRDILND